MARIKRNDFDYYVIDRINEFLNVNRLSVKDLSALAGIQYTKLYQVLHRNKRIKLQEYVMICQALGVDFSHFLGKRSFEPWWINNKSRQVIPDSIPNSKDYFKPF